MPQVIGIQLEPQVIVGVYHLMRNRILQVSSIPQMIRTHQDAVFRIETAALLGIAASTADVLGRYGGGARVRAEEVDVVFHEADDGGVGEEPGFVFVAAGTVAGFVDGVFGAEVLVPVVRGGGTGQDGEEV